MPTSYGLSYWMNILPPKAWPTGALIFSARANSSSRASFAPRPAKMATVSASLIACTRSAASCGSG